MSAKEECVLAEGENVQKSTTRPPYPKRKVAIMLGYCGTNYQGMQLNPNAKTIELDLFNALVSDGLVSKENAVDPKKIAWMRACRTDKGVHAAGQIVSVKMLIKTDAVNCEKGTSSDDLETMALQATVSRLNAILAPDIRVFSIKRTSNSFHAKERCDSRYYEYLLPTYVLAPTSPAPYLDPVPRPFENGQPIRAPVAKRTKSSTDSTDNKVNSKEEETGESEDETTTPADWVCKLSKEDLSLIESYRIDPKTLENLRAFMKNYEGTKNFHNFTIGKSPSDPSAKRSIFQVKVDDPFIKKGIEWVSITFHGQSFMLHQIRKMVGLSILAIRLDCDYSSLLDRSFQTTKINVPKAPALGLLLDKAVFTSYNAKFASSRDVIDFDEYDEQRKLLKDQLIYPKIYEEEMEFHRFMGWVNCNDEHASEFGFLVPFINRPKSIDAQ